MYYLNLRHNTKKENSSQNAFHYLTRTAHFSKHKDGEILEFVRSGNMPTWAKKQPGEFWRSSDKYEIARGRTSTVLTIALPKELSKQHRIELVETLIQNFANTHHYPYTAAVHNHESTLTGEEQPHLHLMYSERSLSDGIERPADQFFKQYRPKNPKIGGAPKITANALGQGKNQIKTFRHLTEELINDQLQRYAPTKIMTIKGLKLEVKNEVSCLSNKDYNQRYGTQLKDVPQIPRWKLHSADPNIQLDVQAQKETIRRIREQNNYEIHKTAYEQALAQQITDPIPAVDAAKALDCYKIVNEQQRFYEKQIADLDHKAKEIQRLAAIQDYAPFDHYLSALSNKQREAMQIIKYQNNQQSLQIIKNILLNDLNILNHFPKQIGYQKDVHENTKAMTMIRLEEIEQHLQYMSFAQKNKEAVFKQTTQERHQNNDYEPPEFF